MPLTDIAVRKAKPRDRPYKLGDERSLVLVVKPNGSKLWRMPYRFKGVEKTLCFGSYPDVSLALARERRDTARTKLAQDIDPNAEKKAIREAKANTFRVIADEWFGLQTNAPKEEDSSTQGKAPAVKIPNRKIRKRAPLSPKTAKKTKWMIDDFLLPHLGDLSMNDIAPSLLYQKVLKPLESRGVHETAHRVRSLASRIFRFAVATGRAMRDITYDLRGALVPIMVEHRPAITEPDKIGELLRALDAYQGQPSTRYALKLSPYIFVRPCEIRSARWVEIDWSRREWRIPGARMKMHEYHVVPLATQVFELLKALKSITGYSEYLFPSVRTPERPMSNNTVNASLRRLGYTSEEMCGHGFRSLASTQLNENDWRPDVIERQLAHAERNKVRAAYNRAQYLRQRREMMQSWANYLDSLRAQVPQDKPDGIREIELVSKAA